MKARGRILSLLRHSKDPLSAKEINDICNIWIFSTYTYLGWLEHMRFIQSHFKEGPYPRTRVYELAQEDVQNGGVQ